MWKIYNPSANNELPWLKVSTRASPARQEEVNSTSHLESASNKLVRALLVQDACSPVNG